MGQFAFVVSPVSSEEPCGPDLEGESDFEIALASLESRFPDSYIRFANARGQDGGEFAVLVAGFNLDAELQPLLALLKRTRDIRLLVPAARLAALSGKFDLFSEIVTGIATLVTSHWDEVHPRAQNGSFVIREMHVSNLDHLKNIVMPLQEQPFITVRRAGPVCFRMYQLATKAVSPREGETVPDEGTLRDALLKTDEFDEVKNVRLRLSIVQDGLAQIRGKFVETVGAQNAPSFSTLSEMLAKFIDFLSAIIEEREPSAPIIAAVDDSDVTGDATTSDGSAPPQAAAGPKGPIQTAGDARAALKSAEAYYQQNEPSNPATLLVRQAHRLVGKSFIEAMTVLNPDLAEKASIRIGGDMRLIVTSDQMTALSQEHAEDEQASGAAEFLKVNTRPEAAAMLEAVERFFQRNEPSSPIPLLLNRARSYSGKDFATLMREVVPKDDD